MLICKRQNLHTFFRNIPAFAAACNIAFPEQKILDHVLKGLPVHPQIAGASKQRYRAIGKQVQYLPVILHKTILIDPQEVARGKHLVFTYPLSAERHCVIVAFPGDIYRRPGLPTACTGKPNRGSTYGFFKLRRDVSSGLVLKAGGFLRVLQHKRAR